MFPGSDPPHAGVRSEAARDAVLLAAAQLLQAHRGRGHQHPAGAGAVAPPTRLVHTHTHTQTQSLTHSNSPSTLLYETTYYVLVVRKYRIRNILIELVGN